MILWMRSRKGGKRAAMKRIQHHHVTMVSSNQAVCTCGWSGASGDTISTQALAYRHIMEKWDGDTFTTKRPRFFDPVPDPDEAIAELTKRANTLSRRADACFIVSGVCIVIAVSIYVWSSLI